MRLLSFLSASIVSALIASHSFAQRLPPYAECSSFSKTDICEDGKVLGAIKMTDGEPTIVSIITDHDTYILSLVHGKKVYVLTTGKISGAKNDYLSVTGPGDYHTKERGLVHLTHDGLLFGTEESGQKLFFIQSGKVVSLSTHD